MKAVISWLLACFNLEIFPIFQKFILKTVCLGPLKGPITPTHHDLALSSTSCTFPRVLATQVHSHASAPAYSVPTGKPVTPDSDWGPSLQ